MKKVESRDDQLAALFDAAKAGDVEKLKELVAAGVDVNAGTPDGDHIHCTFNKGTTALHIAVYHHKIEFVTALLSLGANPNAVDNGNRKAPLHDAAHYRDVAIARLLIEAGAIVNAVPGSEWTPLYSAVWEQNHAMMNELIRAGADVNAGFKRQSPLRGVAWKDDLEGVRMLLKAGADPSIGEWLHGKHSVEILREVTDAENWKGRGR